MGDESLMLPPNTNRSFNRWLLALAALWLIGMIVIAMVQGVQTGYGTGFGDGRVLQGRYGAPPGAGVDDPGVIPDPNPPAHENDQLTDDETNEGEVDGERDPR